MAGDWIKWSKGLPNKPEVVRLAGALQLSRAEVVVRLMAFWEWCDDNIPEDAICDNGSAFVTLSPHDGDNVAFVDALVGTPKFAGSLALVNWIRFRDGRVELPNFGRHNGETAKTRARNAKNQKRKRQHGDTPPSPEGVPKLPDVSPQMSPRDGDKSVTRGEKSIKEPPIPPAEPGGGEGGTDSEQKPGPDRPRAKRSKTDAETDPRFERWWGAYPRHEKRADTAKAFARIDPGPELLEQMLRAIVWQKRPGGPLETRLVDGRSVIPHPTTWLNGQRWREVGPEVSTTDTKPVIKRPDDNPLASQERLKQNCAPM